MIQGVEIVEVLIEKISTDPNSDNITVEAQNTIKEFRGNALQCVREFSDRVSLNNSSFRLGHMILRVNFGEGRRRGTRVTVKIKPPSLAVFKRQRFEDRIMRLLRRNGLCHERQPAEAAAAAQ
jgi:hypothetical protein